ncbi:MAG: hypothetical protein MZU97_24390 [Bacillus subtilis]|nr:hypothetical protein [Bacillus subtilis]
MNDINAKRYYKKINTTFVGLNEVDDFALLFNNILKSGNTTLYQKERRERRVFDDAWMTSVEEAIPAIDRITRSPREHLEARATNSSCRTREKDRFRYDSSSRFPYRKHQERWPLAAKSFLPKS